MLLLCSNYPPFEKKLHKFLQRHFIDVLCNRLGVNLFCNKGIILKCTNFDLKYFILRYPFLPFLQLVSFCVIFCTKLTKNKAWVCGRYQSYFNCYYQLQSGMGPAFMKLWKPGNLFLIQPP